MKVQVFNGDNLHRALVSLGLSKNTIKTAAELGLIERLVDIAQRRKSYRKGYIKPIQYTK